MNIEKELADFKIEIKEKFEKSYLNKTYVFPRVMTSLSANSDDHDGVYPSMGFVQTNSSNERITPSQFSGQVVNL